ncbi:efflux transporter outer membrane subunit [Chromobacterium haemolyticum]|nr:efflux transporter outer membrane subunit [Chromobacterium haemolyticum]
MTQLHYEFPAPISRDYVNAYTAMLMGSWEFDFWGKHRGQIDEAVGQQQAIAFEGAQTRLTLTQAVIAQYTQLQRLQAQSAVLAKRIQLAESRQTLTQARINAGLLPGDNQRGNEVSLHRLRQQQSALTQDSDRARHALAALTGQGPEALRDLQPGKTLTVPAMDATDGLNADLLGKRPDIAAQRARVEATAGAVKAARAEFYPNIKLTAFAGQTSLEFNKLMNGDSTFWGFMPAISLPLFHSGAIQANLGKQRAGYDIAVHSYNQTVLDALRDAADSVSGWQQSGKQLEQARQAQDSSRRAADSAAARFKAGIIINKLNLLDAQDSALAQQSARIDAEAGRKLAWVSLNTALGGGFNAAPATH